MVQTLFFLLAIIAFFSGIKKFFAKPSLTVTISPAFPNLFNEPVNIYFIENLLI